MCFVLQRQEQLAEGAAVSGPHFELPLPVSDTSAYRIMILSVVN